MVEKGRKVNIVMHVETWYNMAGIGGISMGKVLIVETSEEQSASIADILSNHTVQICRSIHAAHAILLDFAPDVLVLGLRDMEGLVFLQELKQNRPSVLVYTAFCGEHMELHLQQLCDYLMYTPFNLSLLADRVTDMIRNRHEDLMISDMDPALFIVRQLLQRPARYGYRYLVSAIKLYVHDSMQAVTKEIYPTVAKEYGTTSQCVEKAIRAAIKQAYAERNDSIWRKYFPTNRNGEVICPSNKAFFVLMSEYIKNQYCRQA